MRLKFIKEGKVVAIDEDNGELTILDEDLKCLDPKNKSCECKDDEENKDKE